MKLKGEKGITLLETIASVAILGIISAAFLNGLVTTSTARVTADERASAKILAETIIETVKKADYDNSYNATAMIPSEFTGYSANLTVENIKNNNIQKLTLVIEHRDKDVYTLETYKVNR